MATDRTNIGYKFENGDIPSQGDFQEVFNSFVHKDEDKANFQMVETGTDDQHYVTPALLRTGLQNIGIITGNSFMPLKEYFNNFIGTSLELKKPPVNFSVKVFKNGQLLLEGKDYTINYDTAAITFAANIDNRNIEVDYWYKNLSPNPGGGSGQQIDFTSFLHTSGNETKNGILTFNNTTPTSTSGIVLTNSGADTGAKVLDVTVSGAGSGMSVQNTAAGTGIKLSNTGTGTGVHLNSSTSATGDPLKVTKDNVIKAKIDSEGIVTAKRFVSEEGTNAKFVKGDGSLDPTTYADDTKVLHRLGNESKDGELKLTHDTSADTVLTITKNNSANCLKLVQNSSSNATTSTIDTSTDNVNRKAISIRKKDVEKAFITHDGNVSGTSFTTLNEKADITDGFLTLAGSAPSDPAPTATTGHAKLYAKTAGTTDLYVMGSDGVEKKIGGEVDLSGKENTITPGNNTQYFRGDKTWQTLDKTAVGLSNVDNTSDLNKPVSTATQTALNAKQATLVSGTNIKTVNGTSILGSGDITISGGGTTITGTANKLAKFNSTGNNVNDSQIIDNGTNAGIGTFAPTAKWEIDSGLNANSGLKLTRIPNTSSPIDETLLTVSNGINLYSSAFDATGNLYVGYSNGEIHKITPQKTETLFGTNHSSASTGVIFLTVDSSNNVYAANYTNSVITKTNSAGATTVVGVGPQNIREIVVDANGNIFIVNQTLNIYKLTSDGVLSIFATTEFSASSILLAGGTFYIHSYINKLIYKVNSSGNATILATNVGSLTNIALNGNFIYGGDYNSPKISRISLNGNVETFNTVGTHNSVSAGSDGNAYFMQFNSTSLTKLAPNGNLSTVYMYSDKANGIVKINSLGNIHVITNTGVFRKLAAGDSIKVLKTDSTGLVGKTTYLEDVQYLKASDVDVNNIMLRTNIKTINGISLLGAGDISTASASGEPSQITITTSASVTTDTQDANGKKQLGKNVIINNGTSAINITVNGGTDFNASYLKHGTGAITFVQAAGRTLVQVNATAALNGAPGSTATVSSIGTTDYLRISNV
ncbi:hypothetical protein Flavo103_03150 [Flavobacterium collinsii]|uniref:hypothetical protein n=1 Tax=Flavobacterium collinsii TaxID=1114861 RepID=UPI0022C46923|nr:hypothetical protein [Flavobacterium collinsii]GIQ57179.1 hypothetical protein Flavo103_03150 [Flavobacterium collinsii]